MTIPLPGANGQVGHELCLTLAALGEVVALARPEVDLAIPESLPEIVQPTPSAIAPVTTADYPMPAARPANSRLATTKLQNAFAVTPSDWHASVDAVLGEIISEMRL